MIRKTKKRIAMICAALGATVLSVSVGVGALNAKPVMAEVVDQVVMSTYVKGDEFVLPSSVTIERGGKSYETTDSYLVFPNGKASAGDKFILNDCGIYKAVFEVKANGVRYFAEKEFTVEESIYSVKMPTSSYTYGALNDNFDDVWGYTEGMLVDLTDGDYFTYNRPFNVYEEDTSNMLVFNLMTMGTDMSVGALTIRLTDCYNPDNYMDIMYLRLYKNELYFRAGISGMASAGLYHQGPYDGYVTIDDTSYMYFINKSGTMLPVNFDQATVGPNATPYNNNLRIYLDNTNPEKLRVRGATDKYAFDRLITELNNETVYPYHWDGFTTGDVYLSISASNFSGRTTAPLEIARIMDSYGEKLMPEINEDTEAPTILLDREGDGATIVKGVPVQIPTATARDISGISGSVKSTVYYAYGTSFQAVVPLTNGTFTPYAFGDYTVIYKATDVYGNEAVKTYVLMASVEADEGIAFTTPEFSGHKAGESITLGGYTAEGFNGAVTVSASLTDPLGETKAYGDTDRIFLSRAGKYVATYYYKDAAYTCVKEIEFTVADAGIIGFTSDVAVPNAFIKNASYSLEGGEAYKYTAAAPEKVATKYYVNFDGNGYSECNPDEVFITATSTVQIKVACAADESIFIESDVIPVVDVGMGGLLKIGEYFVGDFDYEVKPSTIIYSATKAGDVTLDFINPISFANFYFGFANTCASMTITLTDYYDAANVLKIQLYKDASGAGYMKAGDKSIILTQDYASGSNTYVNFSNGMLSVNSADEMTFESPFTMDKCLFSVTIHGASVGTALHINGLCNQAFGMLYEDTADPMIYVVAPERVGTLGGVFTIGTPVVTDVLTPILKKDVTVTVYFNKVAIAAVDGTMMNKVNDFTKTYEIKTNNFGTYLITYGYTDGTNATTHREEVRIIDREAPVLTLNASHVEAKVGQEIAVGYTASDNITAVDALEVWHVVFNKESVVVAVSDTVYVLEEAGVYTVRVWCTDEAGNTTYQEHTLTVK